MKGNNPIWLKIHNYSNKWATVSKLLLWYTVLTENIYTIEYPFVSWLWSRLILLFLVLMRSSFCWRCMGSNEVYVRDIQHIINTVTATLPPSTSNMMKVEPHYNITSTTINTYTVKCSPQSHHTSWTSSPWVVVCLPLLPQCKHSVPPLYRAKPYVPPPTMSGVVHILSLYPYYSFCVICFRFDDQINPTRCYSMYL